MNTDASKYEGEYGLRPIWTSILSMYEQFRALCEKHNLRFWVTGGTLLGAVRHGGFIPWDDDFDVAMPIEDYDKFVELTHNELPTSLQFINEANTMCYTLDFGKILPATNNVHIGIIEGKKYLMGKDNGIDVFPYCGMPKLGLSQRVELFVQRLRRCAMRDEHETLQSKMAGALGKMTFIGRDRDKVIKSMEGKERAYQRLLKFDQAKRVNRFEWHLCAYYDSGAKVRYKGFERRWFDNIIWMAFENTVVPAPKDYKEYLTALFGADYMTLPPESERMPKHAFP